MKLKFLYLLFVSVVLVACQNDTKQMLVEQQKEAQKSEKIFNSINRGWVFSISPLQPETVGAVNHWMEWRAFISEIEQKPKSSIGAFQKKAATLSIKAMELSTTIPAEFNKPAIKARIAVLITKIKTLDLYIHLNQIPDAKVVKLIGEINTEIDYFQLQMEEIITRSKIPLEEGESDIIKMKDSTRAIPDELQ